MVTLAVAAEVENGVPRARVAGGVQTGDQVLESLPLGLGACGIKGSIRTIRPVNQAKIRCCLRCVSDEDTVRKSRGLA